MAYRTVPFPMTLSDFEGHAPIENLLKFVFLHICVAVDKVSTDIVHGVVRVPNSSCGTYCVDDKRLWARSGLD